MIYCGQITYREEFEGTRHCVAVGALYVDHIIVTEDGSLSKEEKNQLRRYSDSVIVVTTEWQDNFQFK